MGPDLLQLPSFPPPGIISFNLLRNKKQKRATSLAVQWLSHCASSAGGMGLIPGRETKIPHVLSYEDFPGGSQVVKTPLSQCRGHGFDPWLGS